MDIKNYISTEMRKVEEEFNTLKEELDKAEMIVSKIKVRMEHLRGAYNRLESMMQELMAEEEE